MKNTLYIASNSWAMTDIKSKILFFLSVFLFIVSTCLRISGPVVFSFFIGHLSDNHTVLLYIALLYSLIFCLSRFMEEFRLACYVYFEQTLQKNLVINCLSKYFSMSFSRIRDHSSSETSIIIDRGLGGIRTALYNAIFSLLPLTAECCILLIVIGLKTGYLLSFEMLFIVLVFISTTFYFSGKTQLLQQKWFSTASENYKIMSEGIRSGESLRTFQQTAWMKNRYVNATDKFIKEVKDSLRPGIILGIIQGGLLFLLFFTSTQYIINSNNDLAGKLSSLVLINGLLLQISIPLLQFSSSYRFFIQGISGARQLFDMMESNNVEEKIPHKNCRNNVMPGIRTKNLSIRYSAENALKIMDCYIPHGKIVILSGPSGAGKSSLAKALAGIIEYRGMIESDYDIHDIFYLHQQVDIFDVSFKNNIILGKDFIEDKFNKAVSDSGFSPAELASLSERTLGERGGNVSGGQAQRIGIARMLYHEAKVMILDEPTTGLDDQVVDNIIAAIKKASAGRTCIIVSHDLRVRNIGDVVIEIIPQTIHKVNKIKYCRVV